MENPNFLKQKYDLHNSEEVKSAAESAERKTGEKVPQNPADRIQNYLDRLDNIIHPPMLENHPNFDRQERNLNLLKNVFHEEFVIKPEEIPESYFTTQQRLAREQGHGDIEISDEQKEQLAEIVIADQKSSLDNWIDYLSSDDATYPDWLKYYAFRSILNLGEYDKENKQFTKRSKSTVKPFPDINREALAYVLDAIEKKYQPQTEEQKKIEGEKKNQAEGDLTEEEKQARKEEQEKFAKLLQGENFAKLYAWAIDKVTPASQEKLANTEGRWVKYDQNSDHMPLVESLQGHGTGWCTAGESTAQAQLSGGDFYVYYSLDENGQPKIPRAAIRMQGDSIAEVRGIGPDQNLDPQIGDVVKDKMKEFPDGAAYEKKSVDMKKLTEIDNKNKAGQELSKDDLIFLYEIDSTIEGFGYQRDPRIVEIAQTRNKEADASIIFECAPDQIAKTAKEINENTKAYIGSLPSMLGLMMEYYPEENENYDFLEQPMFFDLIQKYNIENVYTSFPEGRIERGILRIGGMSKEELKEGIRNKKDESGKNYQIYSTAEYMMDSHDFTTAEKSEEMSLIKLKVGDLGFGDKNPTTDEIYARIKELGLELCPAETGPRLRIDYEEVFKKKQPIDEYLRIGMKQIADSDGDPDVFSVDRSDDGLWLSNGWAKPDDRWNPGHRFVFRFRKCET